MNDAEFENDVKMYGTQTTPQDNDEEQVFENDVKMYGTQTEQFLPLVKRGLRMM